MLVINTLKKKFKRALLLFLLVSKPENIKTQNMLLTETTEYRILCKSLSEQPLSVGASRSESVHSVYTLKAGEGREFEN